MTLCSGGVRNRLATATGVLLLTALASCSSDATDDGPTPTPSASASETASTQADEDAVSSLYDRYWAVRVEAENTGEVDTASFEGIAEDDLVEQLSKRVRDAVAIDVTREGEPTIDQVEVTVTGDSATVAACFDEDRWEFFGNGQQIESPDAGPVPVGAKAERRADAWVLTDVIESAQVDKECS
jgi:hypothetical protein